MWITRSSDGTILALDDIIFPRWNYILLSDEYNFSEKITCSSGGTILALDEYNFSGRNYSFLRWNYTSLG